MTRTIGQPVGGGWVLYETAHRRRLRASMRDLYNACASGDLERPALAYIGGAALNQMTGTTEFDESCGYAVTREGIAPMA